VKDGSIGRAAYQALLARLYGFHLPFEKTAAIEADRSNWLHADLVVLGTSANTIADFPVCGFLPRLVTPEQRLGALYVIEGSTLGGLTLCKGLDRLLTRENIDGRQFFHGRGRGTAQAWSGLLARLTDADQGHAARAEIVGAAVQIFSVFEAWLTSWRDKPHD
jgi:heme oxygenase